MKPRSLSSACFAAILTVIVSLPFMLHALEVRPDGQGRVWVVWSPLNDPSVTGYTIESRWQGQTAWQSVTVAEGCQMEVNLQAGIKYQFRGHATLASGELVDLGSVPYFVYTPEAEAAVSTLTVDITNASAADFPNIQLNVRVDQNGSPLTNLTADNFSVLEWYTESPSPQVVPTGLSVTPPDGSLVRVADIVFVIDDTGSMGSYINSVKNNVLAFADELANRGIDYRLGLVAYKDEGPTQTRWIPDENLIADKDVFKTRVSGLYASGGGDGPENGFGALALATTAPFRPRSQRVFILITDISSHTRDGVTQQGAIDLIKGVGGVCYVAGPNISQWNGTGSVTAETGGTWFPITSNLTNIIDDIASRIADVYVLRYASGINRRDALERTAQVTVTAPDVEAGAAVVGDVTDSDTATYTPSSPPVIALDADTAGRMGVAIDHDTTFKVGVNIRDLQPPYVTEAYLFYRHVGAGSYTSMPMVMNTGTGANGHWQATIPAATAQEPGIEFYVTASDGGYTVTLPESDPQSNPLRVAVLPNAAPVITHTAPAPPAVESDVVINADVADSTEYIAAVSISYRTLAGTGSLALTTTPMTQVIATADGGPTTGTWTATLPGAQFTPNTGGFQYFITAEDNLGVTSRAPAEGYFQVLLTGIDSDGDGLTNGEELALGTDPTNPDTDNDALFDGWEVKGLTPTAVSAAATLDLAALGANPLRKDIFVEIDYLADSPEGVSHVPNTAALERISKAFANSPIINPDGSLGIDLHVVVDQQIPWNERFRQLDSGTGGRGLGPLVNELRDTYFPDDLKRRVFRYCIFGHEFGNGGVLGKADGMPSDTFVVTVGGVPDYADRNRFAPISFMHELGHTLGLRHGGDEDTNFKPNYVSIMNYSFALKGLNRDGVLGVLDYSRRTLPVLAENNLDEPVGIGDSSHTTYRLSAGVLLALGGLPPEVDWNDDGDTNDYNLIYDLDGNGSSSNQLTGFDDWSFLQGQSLAGGDVGIPLDTPLPPYLGDEPDEDIYTQDLDSLTELPPLTKTASSAGGGGEIWVGWPGADSPAYFFRIYRRDNGLATPTENPFLLIATLNATNGFYIDHDVESGHSYTYRIESFDTSVATDAGVASGGVSTSAIEVTVSPSDDPVDTDNDGLLDPWEIAWRMDPADPDMDNNDILDGDEDPDHDGYTNKQEMEGNSNPYSSVSTPPASAFDYYLPYGWNLISIPQQLVVDAADAMFGYSSRTVALISNASNPADTERSNLVYVDASTVVQDYGYFVYIPFAEGLTVPTYGGNPSTTTGAALHRHWNIIGVPSPVSTTSFLALNPSLLQVVRWDNEAGRYVVLSGMDVMEPGVGYFVFNYRHALVTVRYPGGE